MRLHQRILTMLLCIALVPSAAFLAKAQDQEADVSGPPPSADVPQSQDANQPDPPARAARLQFMSGSVSVQPHGADEWVAGALNRPLTNSDNIWADKNSRAEISVGTGLIRIDSESSLTLTNIDENTVQLQLHQGALNLHVRRLYDNERYEVDTPNQAFTVLKPGDYRFDVDSDADKTVVTVGAAKENRPATVPQCGSEITSRLASRMALLRRRATCIRRQLLTALTSGRARAMSASSIQLPLAMFRRMSSDQTT